MSDELARLTDEGLTAFTTAVIATGKWLETLRALEQRSDWPARREALLRDADVDACVRRVSPSELKVLQQELVSLGRTRDPVAIARLARLAEAHPQLRMDAVHGLLAAGPAGLDAAAGPPGETPKGTENASVLEIRTRAAILRGDAPELVARGDVDRKRAALRASEFLHGLERRGQSEAHWARVTGDERWLAFAVDAYFDEALAEAAEAALFRIPAARWKPLVAARKKASAKKPVPRAKPLIGRKGTFLEMLRESIDAGGFPGLSATDKSRRR